MHSCNVLFDSVRGVRLMRTQPWRSVGLAAAAAWASAVWSGLAVGDETEQQRPAALPAGFVDAAEIIPGLVVELKYLGADNFVGAPIDGYEAPRCIVTREAAAALAEVQADLAAFGLGLKVFDAYRPQRAVDHFVRWSADAGDQRRKAEFYPRVDKAALFREGYIAARSGHSRGSTVDVTLVTLGRSGPAAELDMGTRFDFFGVESWGKHAELAPQQRAHRMLLRELMRKHGFRPYDQEWWHFTLENEPFPDRYFDFPIR